MRSGRVTMQDEGWQRVELADGVAILLARRFAVGDAVGLAERLLDPEPAGAGLIKQTPHRSVWRVQAGGESLIVKRYRTSGLTERGKARLLGGRAHHEWRVARALRAADLPAPEPVAVTCRGEQGDRPALFAQCEVIGATPLGGFLEQRFRPGDGRTAEKRAWLERALELLARLHRQHFDHRDFHGGNLLVSAGDTPEQARFDVIDLHRVRIGTRVSVRRRQRALADLLHTLRFALDPDDTGHAVERYLALAGLDRAAVPRWRAAVEAEIARREERRVKSRTRRCLRESSAFRRIDSGGLRGFARRNVADVDLYAAVATAHDAIATGEAAVLSLGARSSVALARCGERRVAVKEYQGDGFRGSLRGRLTRGRAGRAYRAAHGLWVRGVPVPEVVAWIRTPDRSYLLVDEVRDSEPLSAGSFRLAPDGARATELRAAERAVVALLQALVRSGARLNDLSAKNVLLVRTPREDGELAAALCDFDGISLGRPIDLPWMLGALAQLNDLAPTIPLRSRLRVLCRLGRLCGGLFRADVAREIARRSAQRAAKRLGRSADGAITVSTSS